MTRRLLLLDTASLYFRAFYGVPDSLRAPDGTPVNAVRGLLDFIARLVQDHEPDAVAACWDNDWRPRWRVELIPSYKAHRVATEEAAGPDVEEAPDLLEAQIPLIEQALDLLGITVVGADGYEADDVIGTLATTWDGPVDAVTGDRDLFQLADDSKPVRLLYTARGMSRLEVVTAEVVSAKYGVRADQYVDFAVLRGDPSDGLPGVAGVGDKTAAALLRAHGDLDGIAAAAADRSVTMAPRVRANVLAGADYLAAARTVVRVVRDLPLGDPDLTLAVLDDARRAAFAEFSEQWGLGGAEERVVAALRRA
ncbi:MAG: 5'-3' exonuclease [Nocardioidaceae bacterium]